MSSDYDQRLASADRALKFLEKIKQLALEEKAREEGLNAGSNNVGK